MSTLASARRPWGSRRTITVGMVRMNALGWAEKDCLSPLRFLLFQLLFLSCWKHRPRSLVEHLAPWPLGHTAIRR